MVSIAKQWKEGRWKTLSLMEEEMKLLLLKFSQIVVIHYRFEVIRYMVHSRGLGRQLGEH